MCWQPAVFLYHIRRQGSNIPVQPEIKTPGACRPILSLLGQLRCFAEQNLGLPASPRGPHHVQRVGGARGILAEDALRFRHCKGVSSVLAEAWLIGAEEQVRTIGETQVRVSHREDPQVPLSTARGPQHALPPFTTWQKVRLPFDLLDS